MKTLKFITETSLLISLVLVIALAGAVPTLMNTKSYSGWLRQHDKEKDDDKTLSPYFFINSDNPELDQLPLKETKADVNIAGVIADVKITQVYTNSGKKPIEAIYIFPASTRAAVYDMRMTIGDRLLVAKIQEKEKARKDYEAAKSEGKSASLLEQQRPNVFQMNVANIMPGDTIRVEMSYTELLIPEDGVYEFVYPTVVGPRYSNKSEATAALDDKWVSNPYTHEGVLPTYSFNINLHLAAGMPISDVKCPTHEVNINYITKNDAEIKLKDAEKFSGNKDYIVQYRLSGNSIQTGTLLYKGENENFFLTMIQPPTRPTVDQIPPREYIFIMDVSGSMSGYPIETSKKLLKNLIGNLRSTDKFNVMMFAGGSNVLAEKSIDATQANLTKALDMIDKQQGGGGTELLPALKKALSIEKSEGFSRSFVIATDGYVDVEKESFKLIKDNLNKANFFAFGIGSSVNRFIIEGMAHVGMGEPFVIVNEADASAQAEKFRKYIQTPVLTNIKIKYNGFDAYDVEPSNIPDVLAERPIIIYGKYKGEPKGTITLSGNTGTKDYKLDINVAQTAPIKNNVALKYLWARQKIRMLDDFTSFGDDPKLKEEITGLGLKYNLLTNYTSFIAIDSLVRNKTGKSTTVKQPLPLPDKVTDNAIGNYSSVGGSVGYKKTSAKSGSYNYTPATNQSVKDLEEVEIGDEKVNGPYTVVEVMPEFIGGEAAMIKFLQSNLKYPAEAKKSGISGKVFVSFVVGINGEITDVKILKGIGHGCDAEAKRVVKMMSKMWKCGTQGGVGVPVQMNLPIEFTLVK
ncbi:MAG: TonB family protein [Bacteroidetes bacterium]|nr:TonB family protein [Bacteroidota bacterium]